MKVKHLITKLVEHNMESEVFVEIDDVTKATVLAVGINEGDILADHTSFITLGETYVNDKMQ